MWIKILSRKCTQQKVSAYDLFELNLGKKIKETSFMIIHTGSWTEITLKIFLLRECFKCIINIKKKKNFKFWKFYETLSLKLTINS